MKFISYLGGFFFLLFIASCGGSGGGSSGSTGSGTGIEIAEQMALVNADESAFSTLVRGVMKNAAPTGGDYVNDQAKIYVYDESMQVLDTINEILCMVDQTRYADLVNQGDYVALIDKNLCGRNDNHSSDGDNQSSAQSQDFETWTVNSSRADDSSPEIVQFWFTKGDGSSDEGFDEIRAQITITGAKSEAHPFGLFSMDFVGYVEGVQSMSGNLASVENADGNTEFEMTMEASDSSGMEQTHAILAPDGSGSAYALSSFAMDGTEGGGSGDGGGSSGSALRKEVLTNEETTVAYDANHYLANFGDKTSCRDRANLTNNVWEYNLYDSAGTRVTRNSGFGLKYGEHNWGWAGYYGVWLPDEVDLSTSPEVTKADDGTPYTVFQGNGRLIKRTRDTLQLGDFIGDIFQYWQQPSYGVGEFATVWDLANVIWQTSANVNAFYNPEDSTLTVEAKEPGTAGNSISISGTGGFTVSGTRLSGGSSSTMASATVTIGELSTTGDTLTIGTDIFTKVMEQEGQNIQVEWDGSNFIKLGVQECGETGCTFTETDPEAITTEANAWMGLYKDGLGQLDLVVPDDGIITNDMDIPFYSEAFVAPTDTDLAGGNLTLECYQQCPMPNLTADDLNSNPFYTDVTEEGADPYEYVFDTDTYTLMYNGEPVTVTEGTDLSSSTYSWGVRTGAMVTNDITVGSPWEIWSEDVVYNWETGPNPWNKYTTIIDADGNTPTFEAPLKCRYDDPDNGIYFLDYSGPGQLQGIPFTEITSEGSDFSHWVAAFTIADGSELTCDGDTYYSKAMSVEQSMPEVDEAECAGLSTDIGAPTNTFTDPGMDSAPTVTDAPKAISGVLQ